LAHFKTVSGDAYHDASTSSTNDEGGIHSLNPGVYSVIDDHILRRTMILEDDDEDIQVKVEQQNIYLSNIRFFVVNRLSILLMK